MQNRPSPDLKSVVERDAVAWLEAEAERTRVHLANCHKQVAAFSAMVDAPGGEPLQAFVQNWTDLRDSAAPKLQHQEALLAIVRDRDEWREQHENLLSVRQSDLAVVATQKDRLDKLEEALGEIRHWAEAYPVPIFPDPDLDAVVAILTKHGQREQMDRMHASWARHITKGIGEQCRKALTGSHT